MMFTSCTCTPCTAAGVMVFNPRCPVHGEPNVAFTVASGFDGLTGKPVLTYAAAGGETQFNEKTHAEGRTLLRVAKELRAFLAEAPTDDPEAQSLLQDCDTLERVGHWLSTSNAVTFR
jgi:hypothetical protein